MRRLTEIKKVFTSDFDGLQELVIIIRCKLVDGHISKYEEDRRLLLLVTVLCGVSWA